MSSFLPVTFSRPPPLLSARPAEATADADSAPAVALLTDTLREAAARGGSDIHVEPGEPEWRIRLRIDGAFHTHLKPPPHLRDAFTTRIKVLARMDIAEQRVPQDGRLRLPLANGNPEDYRVHSLPVLFGEKLVLRRLDSLPADLSLAALGLAANQQKTIEAASPRAARTRACHGPHRQRQDAVVVLLFADAQREIAQRLFRRRSRQDPACRH
jgi:type IV pilus assembly protein PilB